MTLLAFASVAIFAVLEPLHLVHTLHDFGERPRYFRPRDKVLLPAMRQTTAAIAPGGRLPVGYPGIQLEPQHRRPVVCSRRGPYLD